MAKVVIEAGKTIKSPKALAKQLLGGDGSKKEVAALTAKIREKNNLAKGEDLTGGSVLKVGKVTTKKFGTLVDPSNTNKYSFYNKSSTTLDDSDSGSGGGSGSEEDTPTPEPAVWSETLMSLRYPVKTAPLDTLESIDDTLSDELIANLLFEDLAGEELLMMSRSDTVNGQSVSYQPIKNLLLIDKNYNPNNLLGIKETSDKYFENFTIRLNDKIPKVGNGEMGRNYYQDPTTGDAVLEFINLKNDEIIEVQISRSGIINEAGI